MTTEIDNKTIEQLARKFPSIVANPPPRHSGRVRQSPERSDGEKSQPVIELYQRLLELRIADSYLPALNAHLSSCHSERVSRSPERSEGEESRSAQDRLCEATSILHFEDLLRDWAPFQELFRKASSLIGEYFPSSGSKLEKLQPPLVKRAAAAWYQYSSLHPIADEIGVAWETLSLCLKAAFHPILIKYSETLSSFNQDSWRQKTCPICGGKPDIAFLSKENGTRWLVCSRCDTEWLFFRLECPFCGNRDQDSLAYLTDEKELYRLYTCEQCRKYIKAIDLRRAEGEVLFPMERILTLDMDRQANEAGYKPGWIVIDPQEN